VRRGARASEVAHHDALRSLREAVKRAFDPASSEPACVRSNLAIGGIDRRRFLRVGGVTVASAAVLAACVEDDDEASSGNGDGAGGARAARGDDIVILRTASSIEELAVAAYQTAIDSELVETAAVVDAAQLFQSQHVEHSALFQSETRSAGGRPFTEANPTLLQALEPTIEALDSETAVIQLALDLETVAARTYQANVGSFANPSLNQAFMSIGGVEARHVAVLASVLGFPAVPVAFQPTAEAVEPGQGV